MCLNKKGYVDMIIKKFSNGGLRWKYYMIIDLGLKELKVFKLKW